jgi:hypothetical protein
MGFNCPLHDILEIGLSPVALEKQGMTFGERTHAGHEPLLIILYG